VGGLGVQEGRHFSILKTTVYVGAHCWLPPRDPLRRRWAREFVDHKLKVNSVAPAARTNSRQRFDAAAVLDGVVPAADVGTYGLSVLAEDLLYLNLGSMVI
jgi:hypothetical protein